ncbi:MAG: TAT-variant-translocated molybdopterin oxidoreductase, partial [Ignavibacteria bacterium]|nr:TAT-variant-translocated molybdopterin oxidoreductase [Ignavibacteria bacterium]
MSDIKSDNTENFENTELQPNYWRSFEALYSDPAVIEAKGHEFKEGVTDDFIASGMSNLSRRKFLALLGASAAIAGTACTDYRDKGEIVPYNIKPEEITVGKPNFYASTCTACANACGILIKTREGRPIKVDGNPDHPVNKGKICTKGQASILNLYDPERLKTPVMQRDGIFNSISWKNADSDILAELLFSGGNEIAIITHSITSPTTLKVLEDFKVKYPSTKVYSYSLFNDDVKNSAWQKTFGSAKYPLVKWNEAKVIVSLESDFLGVDGNKIENSRLFAEGRNVETKSFNRLYCVDSALTITGNNADYRLRLRPEAQFEFVMSLMNELSSKSALNHSANTSGYSLSGFASKYKLKKKVLDQLVNDLASNKGKAIIDAGSALAENVHIAVNLLNEALGNSAMFRTDSSASSLIENSSVQEIESLIQKMNEGNVAVVIHFDSNPVYHLAQDFGYKKALSKVGLVVTLSGRENETTFVSKYVLPINHNFESWGDAKTRTGLISLQQPVIAPLNDTRQKEAILLTWIYAKPDSFTETLYHEYLMKNWESSIYPTLNSKLDFKRFWFGALNDGFVLTNENPLIARSLNTAVTNLLSPAISAKGFTVILKENYNLADGSFSHNGWMHELPHPVSKIMWDNYAALSEKTCKDLGVKNNDVIEVKVGSRKL